MNKLNVRGGVVDAVGTQYLAALADQAQIANAQALVAADEEVLRQATLAHDAGVGTNLDVLRARVQLQSEQQSLVRAQNAFAKDKIALNRLIGLPAEQEFTLTDAVPYAELAGMPLDQARALAYERRKDLLALTAQLEVAQRAQKAVKYERLPSLSFNSGYGVLGVTHGNYHGVFTAQGTLKIPIFEEGRFRGEGQVAAAQQVSLQRQIDSLKVTIDAQIRASRMDVESSAELVKVARSNVDLAAQALSDTRDRFRAGVADNLPVVEAQAALAAAQTASSPPSSSSTRPSSPSPATPASSNPSTSNTSANNSACSSAKPELTSHDGREESTYANAVGPPSRGWSVDPCTWLPSIRSNKGDPSR